jgi:hypothetical protein
MLVNARAALHTDAQIALQTNARIALQTNVLITPQTVVQDTPLSRRSLERDSFDQTRKNPYVRSVKTNPWQAAFLAGHLAVAPPDQLDQSKAHILRRLRQGVKMHQSQLPELPQRAENAEIHALAPLIKAAEKTHLESHKKMGLWFQISKNDPGAKHQQIIECM